MARIFTVTVIVLVIVLFTAPMAEAGINGGEVAQGGGYNTRPTGRLWQEGFELLYAQDFEAGLPEDWELGPGWEVMEMDGNQVLSGNEHSWASIRGRYWADFHLRVNIHLEEEAGLHINFRHAAGQRYFLGVRSNAIYLMKQKGPEEFLDLIEQAMNGLGWHQYEVKALGEQITILRDGETVLEYTDAEPIRSGGIAFENLGASPTAIDEIEIWGPPEVEQQDTSGLQWVRTGGPLGGLGYDVRMHPEDPMRMYVSDAYAGVFASEDGGQTWFPSNAGIDINGGPTADTIPIFSLTIDPNNPEILWTGMQYARGIFRSQDGGQTWQKKITGIEESGITFRGFSVEPGNSNIVYAMAEVASWEYAGEVRNGREFEMVGGVVYKSEDGGEHWQSIWLGDSLARYLWIDPRDPQVLYLSTGIFDREAANSDPQQGLAGGEGVLKSTDGGKTWRNINNGLNNLYVGTLYMHPQNADILLAGTGNNQYYEHNGVYLTQDGGETWQQTLDGDNITSVEFFHADPRIAYAGSAGAIYISEDGGASWRKVSETDDGWGPPGIRAGFPIDFEIDPENPMRIFANNYGGGNFLSEDGGRTWAAASQGYTGAQVRGVAVSPSQPGVVVAAARSGLFRSLDGGHTWQGISFPPAFTLEWTVIAIDPADDSHFLAGTNWDGLIHHSQDGGNTWKQVFRVPHEGMGWGAIVFAPSETGTVYAGTAGFGSAGSFSPEYPAAGVYRSTDGGATWEEANDETSKQAAVFGLAVDPFDAQTVYAASYNQGLLKSSDGGKTWAMLDLGRNNLHLLSVAVHPQDPAVLLAGSMQAGPFRSEDGGQTWEAAAAGLNPESTITSMQFDPTDPEIVYLADNISGVYRSQDGGRTWRQINAGLENRSINQLAISGDGRHLYAASEGMGVFRLDLSGEPPQAVGPEPGPQETQPEPEMAEEEQEEAPISPEPAAHEEEEEPAPLPVQQEPTSPGGLCSGVFGLVGLAAFFGWQRSARNPARENNGKIPGDRPQ